MRQIKKMFKQFPVLESKRFILRELSCEDVEDLYHIYHDEETLRYEGMIAFDSHFEVLTFIKDIQKQYILHRSVRWGIEDRESGHIVGLIAMYYINRFQRSVCIGYCMNRSFWGQGIASLALNEVLKYIKYELKYRLVIATIWPDNERSMNLVKKFNFISCGILRNSGYDEKKEVPVDMVAYVLNLAQFDKK